MPKSNPWVSSFLFTLQQQQKPSFETEAANMKRCSSFPRLVTLKVKLSLAIPSLRSTGRAGRGVLQLSHIRTLSTISLTDFGYWPWTGEVGHFCHSAAGFSPCSLPTWFAIQILTSGTVSFGGDDACGCSLHVATHSAQKHALNLSKEVLHLVAVRRWYYFRRKKAAVRLYYSRIGQKITIYLQLKVRMPVAFTSE